MPSHKFHIGDSVMLKPAISRNVPGGVYEVIKQLPHNGREYEYRIKSANEEYERIAGGTRTNQGVSDTSAHRPIGSK